MNHGRQQRERGVVLVSSVRRFGAGAGAGGRGCGVRGRSIHDGMVMYGLGGGRRMVGVGVVGARGRRNAEPAVAVLSLCLVARARLSGERWNV